MRLSSDGSESFSLVGDDFSFQSEGRSLLKLDIHSDKGYSHTRNIQLNQLLNKAGEIAFRRLVGLIRRGSSSAVGLSHVKPDDLSVLISYCSKDDDNGSSIVIGSNEELRHAIMDMDTNSDVLPLKVVITGPPKEEEPAITQEPCDEEDEESRHDAILTAIGAMEARLSCQLTTVVGATEGRLQQTILLSQPKEKEEKEDPPKKSAATITEPEDVNSKTRVVVQQFIADVWNGSSDQKTAITQVCDPRVRLSGAAQWDIHSTTNSSSSTLLQRVGIDGLTSRVAPVHQSLKNYMCEIHSMVVEGNKAYCRLRHYGEHTKRPIMGLEPTGREVSWTGAMEFTLSSETGKIQTVWELGDMNLKAVLEENATMQQRQYFGDNQNNININGDDSVATAQAFPASDVGSVDDIGSVAAVVAQTREHVDDISSVAAVVAPAAAAREPQAFARRHSSLCRPVNRARVLGFLKNVTTIPVAEVTTAECEWVQQPGRCDPPSNTEEASEDPPGTLEEDEYAEDDASQADSVPSLVESVGLEPPMLIHGSATGQHHEGSHDAEDASEYDTETNVHVVAEEQPEHFDIGGGETQRSDPPSETESTVDDQSAVDDQTDVEAEDADTKDNNEEEGEAEEPGESNDPTTTDDWTHDMPVAPEEDETEQPDDASHPHESNATVDRIQELQTTSEEILGEEVIPMLKECMKKVDGFNDRRNGALIHLKDDLQAQASQMEEWHKTVLDGICLQTKTLQKSMHERTSKITSRIFSLESFCRDLQNRKDADQQMRMIANLQAEQAKLRNDIKTLLKAMVTHVNKDDDDDSSSGESSSSSSSSSSGWSSHSDGSIPSDVTIYPPREPKAMPAKNTERKPAKTATKTGAKQASKTAKKTEGKPSAKPAPKPAKASSARKLAMPEDSERSLCSTVDSLILYGFHDETDGEAADAVAKMMDAAKAKAAANTRKGAAKFTGKSRNFKTIDKKTLEDFRSAIRRESKRARSTRFATTRVVPQKTVKGAWGTE